MGMPIRIECSDHLLGSSVGVLRTSEGCPGCLSRVPARGSIGPHPGLAHHSGQRAGQARSSLPRLTLTCSGSSWSSDTPASNRSYQLAERHGLHSSGGRRRKVPGHPSELLSPSGTVRGIYRIPVRVSGGTNPRAGFYPLARVDSFLQGWLPIPLHRSVNRQSTSPL